MYNMNENHPVWGDNIQMAEKRMKILEETNDKIILRGFGTDAMGASFADYGITLHKLNGNVNKSNVAYTTEKLTLSMKKQKIKNSRRL